MPIEYSPSYGANVLSANTSFWGDQLKAQAQRLKDEDEHARSEAETKIQQARLPGAEADSTIRGNQAKLSSIDTANAIIADAAAKIDPADPTAAVQWRRAMAKAKAAGVDSNITDSEYSPALQARVALAYSAPTAGKSLAAMSSNGLPPAGDTTELSQQVANLPPEQIKSGLERVGHMKSALIAVQNSPDPSKTWDAAVSAFGKPELVGRYSTDFQSMWQHVNDMDAAFRSVADRTDMGLPGAPSDVDIKAAGGGIYAVDKNGPGGKPSATALTPTGDYTFVGTDEKGLPIYMDRNSAAEKKGSSKIEAKPGSAGGRMSVFEKKQAAWLDIHPDDPQGALDYANGSKGILTAAQAMKAAQSQASKDLNALALSGAVIEDQQGFLRKATDEHYAELMAANQPASAGGGGGGGAGGRSTDELAPQRTHVGQTVDRVIDRIAQLPANDSRRFKLEQQTKELADKLPPMKDPGPMPPPRVVSKMRGDGLPTVFPNTGQGWALRGGKPVRLW